ncbi:asparaginase [Nocardioides convexus]|uniref:asparaginase n=1 Tax=Nocardioides convexus TaxID=2712224 RepID=UPI002418A9B0|nr:asparaginase [Nocardioides convexus]
MNSARPTVAIGALGGTIASTSSAGDGSEIVPTLTADSLAAAVPGLAALADVRAETLASLPSPSLDEAVVLRTLRWADEAVAAGATGVVVTQGTDTLEESSYLLDLFWDRPEPLVVTGAMRSAQAPGADGPANLLAAVRTALAPGSRERGVLVAFADEVHQARWVAKTDSLSTGAFRSPSFGPVGRCVEGEVRYAAPPARLAPLTPPGEPGNPRVPLLTTYLGDDGAVLGPRRGRRRGRGRDRRLRRRPRLRDDGRRGRPGRGAGPGRVRLPHGRRAHRPGDLRLPGLRGGPRRPRCRRCRLAGAPQGAAPAVGAGVAWAGAPGGAWSRSLAVRGEPLSAGLRASPAAGPGGRWRRSPAPTR